MTDDFLKDLPVFKHITEGFTALRHEEKFTCKIDGMTLQGLAMDWEVIRMDGSSFPMPDHLFRILFEPINEAAQAAYDKTYTIGVGITERQSMSDKIVKKLLGK